MGNRVLIVDDEPDVVRYLRTVLESYDYEVVTAANTAEAMKFIDRRKPDLLCLDIMMPEESGLSLFLRLRRRKSTQDVPVILISGMVPQEEFNLRDYIEDSSIAPPEQYIEKPIDVEKFVKLVNRLTGRKSIARSSGARESKL